MKNVIVFTTTAIGNPDINSLRETSDEAYQLQINAKANRVEWQ